METCQCDFCPDKGSFERNLSNRRIIINNNSFINGISFIFHNNIYNMEQISNNDYDNFVKVINSNFILKTIYMKNCVKKIIINYKQYKNMKKTKKDFSPNRNNKISIKSLRAKKIPENPFSTRDNSKKDFKGDNKISLDEINICYGLSNKQKKNDRKNYDIYLNQSNKKINDSDLNSDNDRATLKEY